MRNTYFFLMQLGYSSSYNHQEVKLIDKISRSDVTRKIEFFISDREVNSVNR